jgi:uncharacterized protein (TIGR03435 family)
LGCDWYDEPDGRCHVFAATATHTATVDGTVWAEASPLTARDVCLRAAGGERATFASAAANSRGQPLERTNGRDGQRTEDFTSSSIAYFLTIRQLFMDRPLVDQTGLKGIYDFKLTHSYGDVPSGDADAPPSIFTAIKEQLGLKFEPVKTAVDVMVIDHIEQPSAN